MLRLSSVVEDEVGWTSQTQGVSSDFLAIGLASATKHESSTSKAS